MGKTPTLVPNRQANAQGGAWVNPQGKPVPPPSQYGGIFGKTGLVQHTNQHLVNTEVNADGLHVEDIHLKGIGQLKDILQDLTTKVDILMEAIAAAHQVGPDGKCREDCWSCKVQETMRGIRVARKLGAPEKKA